MHILVVTNVFHPDRAGGAAVFSDLAAGLVENGHEVTVYTAQPYYPEWRRKSSPSNPWRIAHDQWSGVRIVRHDFAIPRRPSTVLGRLTCEATFALSLLRSTFRDRDVDAVVVYCPLMASVVFGVVRKLFNRAPVFLSVQDIPADAALGSGLTTSATLHRLATRLQSWLFSQFDVVTTISPVMAERLSALSPTGPDVQVIPNWLHKSVAQLVDRMPPRPETIDEPLQLVYAGNIGMKQGLLDLCQRMTRSDASFRLSIHGDGGGASELAKWIDERGDPRVTMGPLLDEASFVLALQEADMFVITEREGAGASFVPSKLIPAVAVGTPILGVCDRDGPLGTELRRYGLGIQCEWRELDGAIREVVSLRSRPDRYRSMQERCLDRARHYDRERWIARITEELASVAQPEPGGGAPAT